MKCILFPVFGLVLFGRSVFGFRSFEYGELGQIYRVAPDGARSIQVTSDVRLVQVKV